MRAAALLLLTSAALCGVAAAAAEEEEAPPGHSLANAVQLRSCLEARGRLSRGAQALGVNAQGHGGYTLYGAGDAIVFGPLVPKAASTTLQMFFGPPMSPSRRAAMHNPASPKPPRAFQLAVVRDPLAHLLAGWGQDGLFAVTLSHGAEQLESAPEWLRGDTLPASKRHSLNGRRRHNAVERGEVAWWYCRASEESRREAFAQFVGKWAACMRYLNALGTPGEAEAVAAAPSNFTDGCTHHWIDQLFWFQVGDAPSTVASRAEAHPRQADALSHRRCQGFFPQRGPKTFVDISGQIDALLKLESFDDDWAAARRTVEQRCARAADAEAAPCMAAAFMREHASPRGLRFTGMNTTAGARGAAALVDSSAPDPCAVEENQDLVLEKVVREDARRYLGDHLRDIVPLLDDAYECLGYVKPALSKDVSPTRADRWGAHVGHHRPLLSPQNS